MKTKNTYRQRGSVFFYILLGVALFAALAYTVSRGIKGQQTLALSEQEVKIAASDILDRSQELTRAVNRIRRRNVSENDFCFSSALNSATNEAVYTTQSSCGTPKNELYNKAGGKIEFQAIPTNWLDSARTGDQGFGEWMFSDGNAVIGNGTGALNLASSVDLIAHVNHLKEEVCTMINEKLGINGIPNNAASFAPAAPSNGVYTASGQINIAALDGEPAGCFQNSTIWSNYIYYQVLIER